MSAAGKDLISRHMESHYRRISAAKGRIDNTPPKAMTNAIKSRASFIKKREAINSTTPVMDKLDPILDYSGTAGSLPKWSLYHSRTGQITAKARSTRSPTKTETVEKQVQPWIPAGSISAKAVPHQPEKTYFKDEGGSVNKEQFPDQIDLNGHQEEMKTSNKNSLLELSENVSVLRTKLEDCQHDLVYLEFLSLITKDILTNGTYTDSGLKRLFLSHVTLNKHKLREDLMWKKIDWLKQKLNM